MTRPVARVDSEGWLRARRGGGTTGVPPAASNVLADPAVRVLECTQLTRGPTQARPRSHDAGVRCIGCQWPLTSEPRVCLFDGHPSNRATNRQTRRPGPWLTATRAHGTARFGKAGCRRASCAATVLCHGIYSRCKPPPRGYGRARRPTIRVGRCTVRSARLTRRTMGHILQADRARGKDVRGPACMWGRRLVRVRRGVGVALCGLREGFICFVKKQPLEIHLTYPQSC